MGITKDFISLKDICTVVRIIRNILLALLAAALLLPLVIMLLVQIPSVQTFTAQKASEILSKKIDGHISVGSVHIAPFSTLIFKEATICGPEGDTIADVRRLTARVDGKSLFNPEVFRVKHLVLDGGQANIRYITPEQTNLGHIIAQLSGEERKDNGPVKLPWKRISVERIAIEGVDFSLVNPFAPEREVPGTSMDFNNLHIEGFSLKASDIEYGGANDIRARIKNISFRERASGFGLDSLSLEASLTGEGLDIRNIRYGDGNSFLEADVRLGISSLDSLPSGIGSLPVSLKLSRTLFDANTAKAFVKGMEGVSLKLYLSGEVTGTVDNLTARNLKIQSETGETVMNLSGTVKGATDIEKMAFDLQIADMETNTADIGRILQSLNGGTDPRKIAAYLPGETILVNCSAAGRLSDFSAMLGINTADYGALRADLLCKEITSSSPSISGNVAGESLDAGGFLNDERFGNLTFDGAFSLRPGKSMAAELSGLNISEFGYNGYKYGRITANGRLEGNEVSLDIHDNDPNLTLRLTAEATLGGKRSPTLLDADIHVGRANLHALNFDSRDTCIVSGGIKVSGELSPEGIVTGHAALTDLKATLEEGTQHIGDIIIDSFCDEMYNITLKSRIAEASYRGASSAGELVAGIRAYLAREMGNVITAGKREKRMASGTFHLKTGNIKPLAAFLMPGLHISEGTFVRAELDGTEAISMHATSHLIAFGSNYVKDLTMDASGEGGPIDATITAEILQRGNIILRNNKIGITAAGNRIILGMRFDNKHQEKRRGDFNAVVEFPPQDDGNAYTLIANLLNSEFALEESNWSISPSRISYRKGKIAVEDFHLSSGEQQYLIAEGVISDDPGSEVEVRLNEFDISLINRLVKLPVEVGGLLTGKASGKGVLGSSPYLLADLGCEGTTLNSEPMGELRLGCSWDEAGQRFNLTADNSLDGRHPIKVNGSYKPSGKHLSLQTVLDSLSVSWIDPLLDGIARETGGSLSGAVSAEGRIDKLSISSEGTRFNDFAATIDFTNVPYVINGPFSITDKGVTFQNDTITDRFGHSGRIGGGLTYNLFKDIKLNVTIDRLREMHVLNTDAAHAANGLYGKAFGSGRISITGPTDNILLNLNLRTDEGAIHFPVSSSGSTRTSILTFVDNSIPVLNEYDSLLISKQEVVERRKGSSGLKVKAKLDITNATEVGLDVKRSFGDMLKAHGNGNIEVNFAKDLLDIKGGYNVEEGSYKFALMGITSKDFIIEPGGTVSFNGDIMQSDLDLTATYRTKASIGALIADSTSVNTRRTVNCGIDISGKLSNPQIRFDIDIPDLDPSTQGLVQAALATEEKQLKQFIALLLSGSFVPDEQSGIVNNTTLLFSNASEIMANQVNTIFRQLDIPLDLGFNYQPGMGGVDIFDVAISTQLFNNRVTINGSIGNQDYMTSYNNSDIVGNVDMEIKLNKNGMLRLNIFSHAADRYSNYLDQTQRNGAGIVYQQDFDTFREFIRKLLRRKYVPEMRPRDTTATFPPPLSVQ